MWDCYWKAGYTHQIEKDLILKLSFFFWWVFILKKLTKYVFNSK